MDMPVAVNDKLRSEIVNLLQYIQRLREELASVTYREDEQTTFEVMSDQLDAIVTATEDATNTILHSIEDVGSLVDELRVAEQADQRNALRDKIAGSTTQIMEACTFQDITGQRVSKIVGSLRFVEERVNAMADIWGRSDIEKLSESMPKKEKTGDEALLNGPQLPGDSISQAEIDKLFS